MKAFDKTKFAIKNAHTKAQMKVLEQEFIDYKGPSLTLQQAFELAKAHQAADDPEKDDLKICVQCVEVWRLIWN